MELSIIFPIAGLGSRFGFDFKPFLLATDYTFIELAKSPFDKLKNNGYKLKYYFIYRERQEKEYNVSKRLNEMFINDDINCIIMPIDTDGPLQTLQYAIREHNINGYSFVCDCDHMINIDPIINKMLMLHNAEVIVPYWNITKEDYNDFGKIKLNKSLDKILDFCEKEYMDSIDGVVKGLIGCYLFRNIENILRYPNYEDISSLLKVMHSNNKTLRVVEITEAYFFGTPIKLQQFRFNRAKNYTLFIDIDGTLIHQQNKTLLPGTIDKLLYWKTQGHKIILTTANDNSRKPILLNILEKNNIPYDELITNLSPGPRYIINDKKPYIPYYCMANGLSIKRNSGIFDVELPDTPPLILKLFDGASFAQVYLVEDIVNNKKFIRKYISNTKDLSMHVDILKRQCEDVKRFNFYKDSICPKILNEYCSSCEYYYDMEYLEGYDKLSSFNNEIIFNTVPYILRDLYKHIYCYRKELSFDKRKEWLNTYLNDKVFPKFNIIKELHPILNKFMNNDNIIINNVKYKSIYRYLEILKLDKYIPLYVCPIHGDLTLENILYNEKTKDYKLIDMAGSRYVDIIEMDIAKLFQSLICEYSSWDNSKLFTVVNDNEYIINEKYIEDKRHIICKIFTVEEYYRGLFYMATYFIRMVPYMIEKSHNHAIFILLLATHYLDYINNNY